MGRSLCSPLPTVRAQHSASDLLWDPSWSLWLGLTGVFKGYVDWRGNTKQTSKVFSIHQCFQNWRQGAYCHVTASESWTLPAKVHYIWVPAYFHPEDPGLRISAQPFSTLQCKLSHRQLRSQGRQSTLGALKVIRLLHLHCPLKWMVCRVLAGGGVLESHYLGVTRKTSSWWSTRKDMACVPSPMSQDSISLPWFWGHICETVYTPSVHYFFRILWPSRVFRSYICIT